MDFIANYWFVWLLILVACIAYAIYNQITRFKRVSASMSSSLSMDQDIGAFFKGVVPLVLSMLMGWGSGILLVIAIVIHVIRYFTNAV